MQDGTYLKPVLAVTHVTHVTTTHSKSIDLVMASVYYGGGSPGTGRDGKPGQIRFTGNGPPPLAIIGASPDDTYLDLDNGIIYKLT